MSHNEVSRTILPQNEIYKIALLQNEAELNKTILPQTGVFKFDAAICWLSDSVKKITLCWMLESNVPIIYSALISR